MLFVVILEMRIVLEEGLFLSDKETILITGGAGFIGSHVADFFLENNFNVIVADNLCSGFFKNINKNAIFYDVDITTNDVENIFKENKIDYVLHLAAQANVGLSIREPMLDAKENILGSINILSLCKKYDVKKIMTASTAAVYGVPKYLPVDETHETICLSFYGLSKLTMEQYFKMFGVDYIIFRFANVYGERQNSKGEAGVVAIFADKMKNNEDVFINGDGEQTRDFVYVKDIAKACYSAVKSDVKNEIINVSTNKRISINNLFFEMAKIFNYKKKPFYNKERAGDIKHSVLDNKKCALLLNCIPETSLRDGLLKLGGLEGDL